jgi:hypothetical protein
VKVDDTRREAGICRKARMGECDGATERKRSTERKRWTEIERSTEIKRSTEKKRSTEIKRSTKIIEDLHQENYHEK